MEIIAAHLDHGLDPDSAERAHRAVRLARQIGVEAIVELLDIDATEGGGIEAAARAARYHFLEQLRRRLGARYVLTAHHRDDQAETIVLRLRQGSGLLGLAGVQLRRGPLVRPLLGCSRQQLAAWLTRTAPDLQPLTDPTNFDLSRPRNLIRHHMLPHLDYRAGAVQDRYQAGTVQDRPGDTPGLRLARLARRLQSLRPALEEQLLDHLDCQAAMPERARPGDLSVDARSLLALPDALRPLALAALHRRAGAVYPASAAALGELERQLSAAPALSRRSPRVGCDCGEGWSWHLHDGRLHLVQQAAGGHAPAALSFFSYTTSVPGSLAVPWLSLQLRLRRGSPDEWLRCREQGAVVARLDGGVDAVTLLTTEPEPDSGNLVRARAFLELPIADGAEVTVRNRRAGDRLQPLGCSYQRRLKEILIDRRVPRELRNSLPLLCVEGQVAWVPTVTLDHRFRVTGERTLWIAEWTSATPSA